MLRHTLLAYWLLALVAVTLLPQQAAAARLAPPAVSSLPAASVGTAPADFPTVDPDYIYAQLDYMATHFLRREAGLDTNLPPTVNGHDEFAEYWSGEMRRDLAGFASTTAHLPFTTLGWQGRAPVVPGMNIEITVPGALHPEQVVVIGCHYDAETTSTQSANDDASGCAIELGVAKALGDYWRSRHLAPARTLRFVAFDAEEQGLIGSINYVNATINGDLGSVVAMFNEEQSGIAYPLRFRGRIENPQLPLDVALSPLQANESYPQADQLTSAQRDAIAHFRDLMGQATPAVFAQFRALGYTTLTYHDDARQPVTQPIFTPDQIAQIQLADDVDIGSDQIPFTEAGIACATFVGNATYYEKSPPPWSYPYDQPDDTIQLMNTYANGTSTKAPALALALALPGMLTTWMLHQPDVLGETPADGSPLATIGDVGQTIAGTPLALEASAVPDQQPDPSYTWDFGDGTSATGATTTHTYAQPGTYVLGLTVAGAGGTRRISMPLSVTATSTVLVPQWTRKLSGRPHANPAVTLPKPDDGGATRVASQTAYGWLIPVAAGLIIALAVVILMLRRQRRAATTAGAVRTPHASATDSLAPTQPGAERPTTDRTPPDPLNPA